MCRGVSQEENEARVNETEGRSKKRGMKDKGRKVGGKRKEDGDNAILTPIRNCRWLQVWSAEMSISSFGYFLPRIVHQRSKYLLLSHPFFFDSRGLFDPDLSPRTRTSSYSHVISPNQRPPSRHLRSSGRRAQWNSSLWKLCGDTCRFYHMMCFLG